jgi:hypothetical protein
MKSKRDGCVDLLDTASFHFGLESLADYVNQDSVRLNFSAMADVLRECRQQVGFAPASQSVVYAAVDLESEAQQRLGKSWRAAGFDFVELDYRDCSPSLTAGENPSRSDDGPRRSRVGAMVPQISYALGTLRQFEQPEVVVLSHAFDFYSPMTALAASGAKVCLAYFRTILDRRWMGRADVLSENSDITFFDLDPFAEQLIGHPLGSAYRSESSKPSIGF